MHLDLHPPRLAGALLALALLVPALAAAADWAPFAETKTIEIRTSDEDGDPHSPEPAQPSSSTSRPASDHQWIIGKQVSFRTLFQQPPI